MEAARNTAQAFTAPVLPLRSCLELDGKDLRWQAIEHRKSALAKLIRGVPDGVAFNQHFTCDGVTSFSKGDGHDDTRQVPGLRRRSRP